MSYNNVIYNNVIRYIIYNKLYYMLNKFKERVWEVFHVNVDNGMGNKKEVSMEFLDEGPRDSDRTI